MTQSITLPRSVVEQAAIWQVGSESDGRVYLDINGFDQFDVRLYIDGNFGGVDEKRLYGAQLAGQLNGCKVNTVSSGVCAAGTKSCESVHAIDTSAERVQKSAEIEHGAKDGHFPDDAEFSNPEYMRGYVEGLNDVVDRLIIEKVATAKAIGAALAGLNSAKRWHQGDKWRSSNKHGEWEAQMDLLNLSIAQLEALSK